MEDSDGESDVEDIAEDVGERSEDDSEMELAVEEIVNERSVEVEMGGGELITTELEAEELSCVEEVDIVDE